MKLVNTPGIGAFAMSALVLAFGSNTYAAKFNQPREKAPGIEGGEISNVAATVEKRDVVITRTFDAPIEVVWKAWTEPEFVMRWWGPTGFTSPTCKIDFRVGGKYVFHMRAPKDFQGGQDFYTAGVYKKIVPLTLIEFTQGFADKDGNAIDPAAMGMPPDFPKEIPSSLGFKRVGNKTELTVTEYGWTVGQMRDLSESGMNECLDKLAIALANR